MTVSFSVSVLVIGDAPVPLDIVFLRTERSEGSGASGAPRRNGDGSLPTAQSLWVSGLCVHHGTHTASGQTLPNCDVRVPSVHPSIS